MNLALDIAFPPWVNDAACVDEDPAIFYPHVGGSANPAMVICDRCPVSVACLAYALEFEAHHPGSRWGIYSGLTPRARRTLADKQRKARP